MRAKILRLTESLSLCMVILDGLRREGTRRPTQVTRTIHAVHALHLGVVQVVHEGISRPFLSLC
jgi:hypothetical protein